MVLNFHIPNNFLVLAAISAKLLISNIRFSWKWELPMTSSVSNEYALLPNMNVPECFASILMLEDTGKAFW